MRGYVKIQAFFISILLRLVSRLNGLDGSVMEFDGIFEWCFSHTVNNTAHISVDQHVD